MASFDELARKASSSASFLGSSFSSELHERLAHAAANSHPRRYEPSTDLDVEAAQTAIDDADADADGELCVDLDAQAAKARPDADAEADEESCVDLDAQASKARADADAEADEEQCVDLDAQAAKKLADADAQADEELCVDLDAHEAQAASRKRRVEMDDEKDKKEEEEETKETTEKKEKVEVTEDAKEVGLAAVRSLAHIATAAAGVQDGEWIWRALLPPGTPGRREPWRQRGGAKAKAAALAKGKGKGKSGMEQSSWHGPQQSSWPNPQLQSWPEPPERTVYHTEPHLFSRWNQEWYDTCNEIQDRQALQQQWQAQRYQQQQQQAQEQQWQHLQPQQQWQHMQQQQYSSASSSSAMAPHGPLDVYSRIVSRVHRPTV